MSIILLIILGMILMLSLFDERDERKEYERTAIIGINIIFTLFCLLIYFGYNGVQKEVTFDLDRGLKKIKNVIYCN